MASFPPQLILPNEHRQEMLAHVLACLPEESCGMIGGRLEDDGAHVMAVLPVENELHSPVRFRMAPEAQLQGFLWLEEQGLELVAVFHSHPNGPNRPSPTDLAEFAYPGVVTLIWSPAQVAADDGAWEVRGFAIDDGKAASISISLK